MVSEQEVDRLAANLRERFGARLSDSEAAVVRERVAAMLRTGEELRAVPLDNADEPFTVFTPLTPPRADE